MITASATQNDTERPMDDLTDDPASLVVTSAQDGPEEQLTASHERLGYTRLRVPLHLWDGKNYVGLRNTTFKLEMRELAMAFAALETLKLFFRALETRGIRTMNDTLRELLAEQESPKRRHTDRAE
jgi:hypothetical protein